ncbi:hypothetical protein JCM5353_005054 [Sporobolomyces roseus]
MPPRRKKQLKKTTPASSSPTTSIASTSRSSGMIKTLPFSLEEAVKDPEKYRTRVTRTVWEEQVCLPLMKERYEQDEPVDWTKEICYFHTHAEDQLARIYDHGTMIARLHRNITDAVLEDHYIGGSFEGWWRDKMSESAQRNLLETALDAASNAGGGCGFRIRLDCPDVTISAMLKDHGMGFISLLRQIVQSAQAFKQQEDYYPIISEAFDRYYQIDRNGSRDELPQDRAIITFQVIVQHDRMWLISVFVSFVPKASHYGHADALNGSLLYKPRPTPLRPFNRGCEIVKPSSKPQSRREAQEVHDKVNMISNEYLPGVFFGVSGDCNALKSSPLDACRCCRRVGAETEELKGKQGKMLYCAKCLKLDHHFAYCSIDCQKHEFKHGGHKEICGKLFSDLALAPMGWTMPPLQPPLSTTLQYQLFPLEKDGFTPPFHKTYHVRYYVDGPPHPNGPDDTPISWNRRCACSMVSDRTEFDKLLNRAIETRSEKDIKAIVSAICEGVRNTKPGIIDDAIRHCADDWDLEESTVREWVEEDKEKKILRQLCEISKIAIANERGGRRSNSTGDKLPHDYVLRMLEGKSLKLSRSQSAPPRRKYSA